MLQVGTQRGVGCVDDRDVFGRVVDGRIQFLIHGRRTHQHGDLMGGGKPEVRQHGLGRGKVDHNVLSVGVFFFEAGEDALKVR